MDWIIGLLIVLTALVIVYYALRLGFDLLVIIGMVIGGAIKLVTWPFRHRH
jgi:hypothetical protein